MATQLLTGAATTAAPVLNEHPLGIAPGTPVQAAPLQQAQQPQPPTSSPVTLQDGTQLDSGVVKVLHAIRSVESNGNYNASGDNGTSAGAFQWNNYINGQHVPLQPGEIPANFQNAAKTFGLDPADFSPANQNKVAYAQIAAYKAKGLSPLSIDALWNGAKPDPQNPSQYVHNNPQRAATFQTALQQEMTAAPQTQAGPNQPADQPPSIGGFLGNAVTSGANFLGNIGNAALHPIQTIQGIGGAAVGGLQEAGGQQNDNTAKFDALKNYFVERYKSPDTILHTAYTDPVGLAADISAVLGVGGGALGVAGKVGELSGFTDAAALARAGASGLGRAAELTNPLTPVIAGASKLLKSSGVVSSELGSQLTGFEPATIDKVVSNPEAFTPDEIANSSRTTLANQVKNALDNKEASLSETGGGYEAVKQGVSESTGVSAGGTNAIPVAHDFLESQLRQVAKVDVVDGKIIPTTVSKVGKADVAKLQDVLDTFKPAFQSGFITPEEFLTLRQRLAAAAYNDSGIKNTAVAKLAEDIRNNLNTEYRPAVPGLSQLDASYSSQLEELKTLRKGILNKDGELLDTAINKIANATGKGKDLQLAKLEQLVPGISKKIEVLKAIEDIQKAGGTKVGTYPSAFLKAGGVMAGLATGNMPLVAASAATMIIASPGIAVPLLRVLGGGEPFVKAVMAHLAKFATIGAVASASQESSGAQTGPGDQTPQETVPQTGSTASAAPAQTPLGSDVSSPNPIIGLEDLAKAHHFDLASARKDGHTDEEILAYLKSL